MDQSNPISTPPPALFSEAKPATPAAPVTPDAAPKETPKEENPRFAKAFAQISAQQKQIQRERDAIAAERKAMADKYKPYEEEDKLWSEKKALEVMKRKGLSFDDLAKMALNDGKPTADMDVKDVRAEMQALRDELKKRDEDAKVKEETSAKEESANAIKSFKADISKALEANLEKFELLNSLPQKIELVYQKIDEVLLSSQENGGEPRLISPEEAADFIEKALETELETKLLGLKKVQARMKPLEPVKPAAPTFDGAPRTLTNTLSTQTPTPTESARPRSMEESMAEAAKLLRFS